MASGDSQEIPPVKFEYLDHTADVQIHSWGNDLKEAFEQCGMAMFAYMTTDYDSVEMLDTFTTEAEGDDIEQALFHFLDEWLFAFSAEPFFIARKIVITEFIRNEDNIKIKSIGYGEEFTLGKHPPGTEVKAITYSNMQVHDHADKHQHEIFVIIDI